MDEKNTLKKMHYLHLMLADELKKICDKNGIEYFIFAGTLLGAVRHDGFIPWDDDMDFGMKRENYDRFIQVCDKELDKDKFYLQTDMNDKYYAFNFAKLRLNGTYVEESFSSGVSANQGIYIDIFPLDYVYDSRIRKFFQFKIFWIARNLLWVKCGYGEKCRKKTFSYKIAKFLSLFFSIDLLKKIKYRVISSCKDGEFVVTSDGTYGLKKETLKKSWISNLSKYKFENREYFGIESYDEYLTYMYKDYMQIPPVSKQNHHDRSKVDFGKY